MDTNNTPSIQLAEQEDQLHKIKALLQAQALPTEDIQSHTFLYLYCKGENPIGTGGLEYYGHAALLRSVSVIDSEKDKGHGKAITQQLEKIARENGAREVYLLTNTAPAFFANLGYAVVERSEVPIAVQASSEFSSVCPSTAIVMRKPQGEAPASPDANKSQ